MSVAVVSPQAVLKRAVTLEHEVEKSKDCEVQGERHGSRVPAQKRARKV